MDSSEPIGLHFAYTLSDMLRARRLYRAKTTHYGIGNKFFAIVWVFIGLYSIVFHDIPVFHDLSSSTFALVLFPVLAFFFAVMLWFDLLYVFALWNSFRKRRNEPPEQYDFRFDEFSAAYTTETVDVKVSWAEFKEVFEDRFTFLLVLKQGKGRYWAIPTRGFASADDIAAFRRLTADHIPA